jgi:hypothetical protein
MDIPRYIVLQTMDMLIASNCIEMGAKVNARTNGGWAPLHGASLDGHVNVVRVLLDAGAIVDAADDDGETPLYETIRDKHPGVARLLIDGGAKVSNVKLDEDVPAIPDWVTTFIESRSNCRTVSLVIIGIHKYRRTTATINNDVNVLRLNPNTSGQLEWMVFGFLRLLQIDFDMTFKLLRNLKCTGNFCNLKTWQQVNDHAGSTQ